MLNCYLRLNNSIQKDRRNAMHFDTLAALGGL